MNKILKKYEEVLQERANQILLTYHHGEVMTYADFDHKVNILSDYIKKHLSDVHIVPVLSQDHLDYLLSMFACWKAKKIYMPMNSNTAPKKVEALLERLNIQFVLENNYLEALEGIQKLSLKPIFEMNETEEARRIVAKAKEEADEETTEIAYLLTTSGTTGNPKMVKVSFDNLYWLLSSMNDIVPFKKDDVFILSTPPQFDVSFHENLAFLFGEGRLQVAKPGTAVQQFKDLKRILETGYITHIALSPTSLKTLLAMSKDNLKQSHLKYLVLAGEVLPVHLVNQVLNLLPDVKLFNCYGPTETTIYATYYPIEGKMSESSVPIGMPIQGADIQFFQDGALHLEQGEICIAGEGVSKGYYGNKTLTEEKFCSFAGKVYYRTGDLGYRKGQLIYYQGRQDRQVKINGIRIELEEVEQAIQKYVEDYVHFTVLKIDNHLVLFSDQKLDFPFIQKNLRMHLAEYMIPKHVVYVHEMKRTASNKLDTDYLKAEYSKGLVQESLQKEAEENELHQILSGILEVPSINEDTNLLLLPKMDSLTQIEILVALEEHVQKDLPEDFIKRYPSIRKMKAYFFSNTSQLEKEVDQKDLGLHLSLQQQDYFYNNLLQSRQLNHLLLHQNEAKEKPISYLQKAYIVDGFQQILKLKILLPQMPKSVQVLEEALYRVIEKNDLLRCILNETMQATLFPSYEHKIPVLSSHMFAALEEKIENDLKQNIFGKLLWEVYYLEDTNEIHFLINHLITDQSSLSILEKDMLCALQGEVLETKASFSSFVDFIEQNSKEESLEVICAQGFEKVLAENFYSQRHESKQGYFKVKTPYKGHYDNIVYGNYLLAKLLCASQKQELVSGSTILNIREFKNKNFTDTFGDIHSTVPFVYKKGQTEEEFKKSFDFIYRYFIEGDNLNHSIYKNYPHIPEALRKYEFYLDDNLKCSNNFLGAIREKDLQKTIESLQKQQYALENFSKAKLYMSFFICVDELIFVPITKHLLDFSQIESV